MCAAESSLHSAEAKDFKLLRETEAEEKHARAHSMPTKLLGWLMIAAFGLEMAGAHFGTRQDFGGPVFLVVGILVLRGSQFAIRFATFFIVPGALIAFGSITWTLMCRQPIEIGRTWVDYRDLEFWTLGVSPAIYLAVEAILAICAFKLRGVGFWTSTVKGFACILGIIMLIQGGFKLRDWFRQRAIARDLHAELQASREHVSAYGGTSARPAILTSEQTFEPMARLRRVIWNASNSNGVLIYQRELGSVNPNSKVTGQHSIYSELFRTPAGEWGKLELELILPPSD